MHFAFSAQLSKDPEQLFGAFEIDACHPVTPCGMLGSSPLEDESPRFEDQSWMVTQVGLGQYSVACRKKMDLHRWTGLDVGLLYEAVLFP